jgi:hypothetical protein
MKRLFLVIWFVLISFSIGDGQSGGSRKSLVVANCKSGEGICDTQELVRYDFENGEYVSKDIVLSAPTSQVRYDLGNNSIFRKRYVITNWGDVVDVASKKLVHKGDGEFAGIEGDAIISRVKRVDVSGVFAFDLNSNHYDKVRSKPRLSQGH